MAFGAWPWVCWRRSLSACRYILGPAHGAFIPPTMGHTCHPQRSTHATHSGALMPPIMHDDMRTLLHGDQDVTDHQCCASKEVYPS
eukprot:1159759-Pelagomonas_calceolata.AAC.1